MSWPRCLLLAALALFGGACQAARPHAAAEAIPAQGLHVRHLRMRVAPAQTKALEALLERCVQVAQQARLDEPWRWLAYRESPGRYWLVTFSQEREGFAVPDAPDPLAGWVRAMGAHGGSAVQAELEAHLTGLELELEWSQLARQKATWSTVDGISTDSHPTARMMVRTVRPGSEAAFEAALAARVAFLAEHDYPLPIEGFVVLEGAPGTAMQVVFPRDWPSFHAGESFWDFAQALPEPARKEYLRRKAALMATMSRAEYYDADYLPKASYQTP